jgi:hypothetical protein
MPHDRRKLPAGRNKTGRSSTLPEECPFSLTPFRTNSFKEKIMDRAESEPLVRHLTEFVFNQKRIGLIDHSYSPDCQGGSPDGPFE